HERDHEQGVEKALPGRGTYVIEVHREDRDRPKVAEGDKEKNAPKRFGNREHSRPQRDDPADQADRAAGDAYKMWRAPDIHVTSECGVSEVVKRSCGDGD